MDKKSIGGIALLILFLVFWQFVLIPMIPEEQMYKEKPVAPVLPTLNEEPIAKKEVAVEPGSNKEIKEKIEQAKGLVVAEPAKMIAEEVIDITTEVIHARFSNRGGQLVHLALLDYHPAAGSHEELLLCDGASLGYGNEVMSVAKTKEGDVEVLTFTGSRAEVSYRFSPKSHFFDISVKKLDGSQTASFILGDVASNKGETTNSLGRTNSGAIFSIKTQSYGDNSAIYASESLDETTVERAVGASDLQWAGWRGKYFAWLVKPSEMNKGSHNLNFFRVDKQGQLQIDVTGQSMLQYQIYAGPIDKNILYSIDEDLYMPLFNYTGIDFVIHFLLWLLSFYNSIPGINMGVAIIMLTITVKLVLFPLTLKSQTSMFMMSKLGPKIKELQEKYKNDRQMLGMKQMEMFKENGVNPLAGCLPMFIQMPVFISLFSTIGEGFDLRQANFVGWMNDLSAPDGFSILEISVPFINNGDGTTNLNLLPFLYIITMFLQQSLMPKSTDPQQQQMQKMMKFMMMGFAVILYNYSSGLMLYFVGSNILGMTESYYIRNKVMPKLEAKVSS